MRLTLTTLALAAATAPAIAHEEAAFASPVAHELGHAHAFGGPLGLVAAAAAVAAAFVLAPKIRAAARGYLRR